MRPRSRRGLTLMEIVVVIAIMGVLLAVALPTVRGVMDVQRGSAVKELALTWTWLRDEAALRNVSFRLAFDLDTAAWKVEVGDPGATIFGTPEAMRDWDRQQQDALKRFTQREIDEGAADEVLDAGGRFARLTDPSLEGLQELPSSAYFAWVWTPQYGEPVEAPAEPADDPEGHEIVFAYVMPDGFSEPALVCVADRDDPGDAVTIEVEPISGRLVIHDGIFEPDDRRTWSDDDAPELPL